MVKRGRRVHFHFPFPPGNQDGKDLLVKLSSFGYKAVIHDVELTGNWFCYRFSRSLNQPPLTSRFRFPFTGKHSSNVSIPLSLGSTFFVKAPRRIFHDNPGSTALVSFQCFSFLRRGILRPGNQTTLLPKSSPSAGFWAFQALLPRVMFIHVLQVNMSGRQGASIVYIP